MSIVTVEALILGVALVLLAIMVSGPVAHSLRAAGFPINP